MEAEDQETKVYASLAESALDIVIKSNYFELKDSLSLRATSTSLKKSVDSTPSFKTAAFYQVLRNGRTAEFPTAEVINRLPSFYRAIINKDIVLLKKYLENFFVMMLNNLVGHPEIVCRLVEISAEMKLMPEDFENLGHDVVRAFRFLTQPIKDNSESNQKVMLDCIPKLRERGYTEKQCANLEASIKATFEFLRDRKFSKVFIYKNLSGANFADANLTEANLFSANLAAANLSRANLAGANLSRANLAGANLRHAHLTGERLGGIRVSGMHCLKAKFVEANLAGADFQHARFYQSGYIGVGMLASVMYWRVVFFTKSTIVDFINNIEKSVKLNPAGILPLLFEISEESLSEIDSDFIVQLKNLSRACLIGVLTKIESVEMLRYLFYQVCDEKNIFRCSPPKLKNDVKDLYPEVLTLIANTYLSRNLSCKAADVENDFRAKLIEEISKQKSILFFLNDGWNNLLAKINKTELKSSQSFVSRPRANQM